MNTVYVCAKMWSDQYNATVRYCEAVIDMGIETARGMYICAPGDVFNRTKAKERALAKAIQSMRPADKVEAYRQLRIRDAL